jgi:asparagine synthase (glutamine-hydrolysing)
VSIVFGIRKPSGAFVTQQELACRAFATDRYALDGVSVNAQGQIGMGYQPYHTHERSNLESQPAIDGQGNMLVLDGRIDNHLELCDLLHIRDQDMPDSFIVLTAFLRWGEACFSRLIGEWALALWSNTDKLLYLARDHAGTRTLFYEHSKDALIWSTYLETFFSEESTRPLSLQYAAAYLGFRPIAEFTPYDGILAVPPMHYLIVREDRILKRSHWDWVSSQPLLCKSDSEYEEIFLSLFRQAVKRRSGSGAPIVSHLSGGIDSTSIVCMADHIGQTEHHSSEPIDTLSFYDDSEPNWDERPYFSAVESIRGRTGSHIETSWMSRTFDPPSFSHGVYLYPGADSASIQHEERLRTIAQQRGYRAILSGTGGDEVLGGVPTASPELAGYLVTGEFQLLLSQATEWCLADGTALAQTIGQTARYAFALYWRHRQSARAVPSWIARPLRRYCVNTLGFAEWIARLGHRPVAIDNILTWLSILETLPHSAPSLLARYEYRYPYLDRDLAEFLFRIPREQLVRPGRRRSLMRRALRNIVPEQVLERRRKAYVIRGPLLSLRQAHDKILGLFRQSLTSELGFIDEGVFRSTFESVVRDDETKWLHAIVRTILFELWLRSRPMNSNSLLIKVSAPRSGGASRLRAG